MSSEPAAGRMRAAVWGWVGGLGLEVARKVPAVGRGEVLVKVRAAAINPVDYKLGRLLGAVVGHDVAGVVEKVGEGVTGLEVGDEVFGTVAGSLADYAVSKPESLGKKAPGHSFVEAAAMPVVYMTGLQSLRDAGGLQAGDRVLVIGASGGCGLAALQLARSLGAGHIAAVCSGKNEALVREHGAAEVVDYTKENLLEHFKDAEDSSKFDVIYDAATGSGAGEDYKATSMHLLRNVGERHGQYVAINGAAGMWVRHFTIGQKKDQHMVLMDINTEDLEHLATLDLKPVIARQLPLNAEAVKEGFELLRSRRAVGKIVFDMSL